ncbi:ribosome silencing factor [Collinsella sp. zg1085]|nr:ribosome silencing factor [Collinsella sp. zg1085]
MDRLPASTSQAGISAETLARTAAEALSNKKAEDICVLNLTQLSDVCDYFVIATGLNSRQLDAMIDETEEVIKQELGEHPLAIEGRAEGTWVLLDYGSVLIHIFTPETREYYQLEALWGDAERLAL